MNTAQIINQATEELKASNDAADLKEMQRTAMQEWEEKRSYTKREIAGEKLSEQEFDRYIFLIKKEANAEWSYNNTKGYTND